MNNTKTLAIVAIFMAATLVVGTLASTATTQTALAYQKKNRGGSQENSRDGNTVTIQKCKQDGTVSGFDNTAEQECQNVICTHPGENATCTQEGVRSTPTSTPTPTPTPTPEPITTTLRIVKQVVCQPAIQLLSPKRLYNKFIYCWPSPTIFRMYVCYWKWCRFYTAARGFLQCT